jgi:hypothetical protein
MWLEQPVPARGGDNLSPRFNARGSRSGAPGIFPPRPQNAGTLVAKSAATIFGKKALTAALRPKFRDLGGSAPAEPAPPIA